MSVSASVLKCVYCGSDDVVVNDDGEYVCRACGTVLGQGFAQPIKLTRVHTVGTEWDFADFKLHAALSEVKRLSHVLNLPERCVKEAAHLIELAVRGKKVSVAQPEALAVVALFYGCRQAGILLPLRHFTPHVSVEKSAIKRAVWNFSRLTASQYEKAILNASKRFGLSATAVLELWERHKRKLVGKKPRVVVAVLIYLAKGGTISISEVSRILGVSTVSVKKALAQLKR